MGSGEGGGPLTEAIASCAPPTATRGASGACEGARERREGEGEIRGREREREREREERER